MLFKESTTFLNVIKGSLKKSKGDQRRLGKVKIIDFLRKTYGLGPKTQYFPRKLNSFGEKLNNSLGKPMVWDPKLNISLENSIVLVKNSIIL